ncbi:hypothetical protein [Streptomyces sp. NBC_00005]|uniref:hypothetical protein n=1 Tax=Streptomyces sp. NBC_00005 TaxID=2903609 RepID=UPI0032561F27
MVVFDPGDDVVHTRAALAMHHPATGRVTIHPTPGTDSTLALAHNLLDALGKTTPVTGYRATDPAPVWTLAAAWLLALPVTRLTVLRAHLLPARGLNDLLALRVRTGVRLYLVCHQPQLSAVLEQALARTGYDMADADAVLSHHDQDPPHVPRSRQAAADTAEWISLPALTTLTSYESSPACACTAPTAAERGFRPPALPIRIATRVAHRLSRAAHPHLAAHLAAAVVTAASTSQLDTARVLDLALDGTTLTLHDRHNVRQGCTTYPVPVWAQPLLRAAAFTHLLATAERSSPLFADPLGARGLPSLRDFAEHLKLRPPQPPPPLRTPRGGQQPAATIWPVSGAHHARCWTAEENMQGCPQPPGHRT